MAKSKSARNLSKKKKKRTAGPVRPKAARGSARPAPEPGAPIHIRSVAQFESYLERSEPVVIDFWATWCVPCKITGPVFDRVSRQFAGKVNFLKVNTEELGSISNAFGIRSIPTILVMLDGEVIDSHIGVINDASLAKMAQRALDKKEGVTFADKVKRLFGRGKKAQGQEPEPVEGEA